MSAALAQPGTATSPEPWIRPRDSPPSLSRRSSAAWTARAHSPSPPSRASGPNATNRSPRRAPRQPVFRVPPQQRRDRRRGFLAPSHGPSFGRVLESGSQHLPVVGLSEVVTTDVPGHDQDVPLAFGRRGRQLAGQAAHTEQALAGGATTFRSVLRKASPSGRACQRLAAWPAELCDQLRKLNRT